MASADWDEVTYLTKRAPKAAESKSDKVHRGIFKVIFASLLVGSQSSHEKRRGCRNNQKM